MGPTGKLTSLWAINVSPAVVRQSSQSAKGQASGVARLDPLYRAKTKPCTKEPMRMAVMGGAIASEMYDVARTQSRLIKAGLVSVVKRRM